MSEDVVHQWVQFFKLKNKHSQGRQNGKSSIPLLLMALMLGEKFYAMFNKNGSKIDGG